MGVLSRLSIQGQVRASKRSWWEVLLLGGSSVAEWQTTSGLGMPILSLQARSRWEDLDHSRIVAARLWCPDGSIGEVQATGPHRIFQFKSGRRVVPMFGEAGTVVDAHAIGTLDGEIGCRGWEWTALGLAQFSHPDIRTLHERYGQGPFNLEILGIRL